MVRNNIALTQSLICQFHFNDILGLPIFHFCLQLLYSCSLADHNDLLPHPLPHLLDFHIHPQRPPSCSLFTCLVLENSLYYFGWNIKEQGEKVTCELTTSSLGFSFGVSSARAWFCSGSRASFMSWRIFCISLVECFIIIFWFCIRVGDTKN